MKLFFPSTNRLIRFFLLLFFISGSSISLHAQYFYNEWLSNREAQKEWKVLQSSGFRNVQLDCFEADDSKTNSFFCERKFSRDFLRSTLYTRTSQNGKSILITEYFPDGRLRKSYDSSANSVRTTTFVYDDQIRLKQTINESRSMDEDFVTAIREDHIYFYDDRSFPQKMIRINQNTDSLTILFSSDENGNLSIEKETKSGAKYYYYYNPARQLTDIVPVNEYKQSMKPDYMFDYDSLGNLIEMKSTDGPGGGYTTWRYLYENGLKKQETVFAFKAGLVNRFEYRYR
jgi:hypothetical protein